MPYEQQKTFFERLICLMMKTWRTRKRKHDICVLIEEFYNLVTPPNNPVFIYYVLFKPDAPRESWFNHFCLNR